MTWLGEKLAHRLPGYALPIGKILAIYVGLMLVVFLAALDQTIVATAGPEIVANLGGIAQYPWLFTSYLLASTVAIPIYGRLGDIFGTRKPLLFGVGLFMLGSLFASLADGMLELIASRVLQGIGGGGLMPLAQATIAAIVPLRERGRFQGLIVAAYGTGSMLGPIVGAELVGRYGWPSIFYINLPIGGVALLVIAATMPTTANRTRRSIDWTGGAFLGASAASLLVALVWGGHDYPWLSGPVLSAFALALGTAAVCVFVERRVAEPILPFGLARQRTVAASLTCLSISGAVQLGCIVYIPLFVEGVIQSGSAGAALVPMLVAMSLAALVSGQIITRTGRLLPAATVGPLFAGAGLLFLSQHPLNGGVSAVSSAGILIGVGLGLMNQVFMLTVQNSVPHGLVSSATGMTMFARLMGSTLGVALVGAMINQRLPAGVRFSEAGAPGLAQLVGPAQRDLGHALKDAFLVMAAAEALILIIVCLCMEDVSLRRSVDSGEVAPSL